MPITTDPPAAFDDGPTNHGDDDRAPPEPPPLPAGLSVDTQHQHSLAAWQTRTIVGAIDRHDRNDSRRSRRLALAIKSIDDDLDAVQAGATGWRDSVVAAGREVWSVFRQPLAALVLAVGAYWTWRLTGMASTPTPVVVAQPVTIAQPALPAPVLGAPVMEDDITPTTPPGAPEPTP